MNYVSVDDEVLRLMAMVSAAADEYTAADDEYMSTILDPCDEDDPRLIRWMKAKDDLWWAVEAWRNYA